MIHFKLGTKVTTAVPAATLKNFQSELRSVGENASPLPSVSRGRNSTAHRPAVLSLQNIFRPLACWQENVLKRVKIILAKRRFKKSKLAIKVLLRNSLKESSVKTIKLAIDTADRAANDYYYQLDQVYYHHGIRDYERKIGWRRIRSEY